jgi:hypothetical protein
VCGNESEKGKRYWIRKWIVSRTKFLSRKWTLGEVTDLGRTCIWHNTFDSGETIDMQ